MAEANKMKESERTAKVRAQLAEMFPIPEGAYQTGPATFALELDNGVGEVTFTAKKTDFDPVEAENQYKFDVEEAATKKAAREAEREAKKAADLAKKAAKAAKES